MPIKEQLLDAILSQIEQHDMFTPGDHWLLAISGGPDSMAMLCAILILQDETRLPLNSIHIAHLNHKLRGADADADAEFVRTTAKQFHLEATIESADIAALAKQGHGSIETTARKARYEFLARLAHENNCSKIALAHNLDDQVETVLHRIIRGTGVRGLAGIPAVRPIDFGENTDNPVYLIRPLLAVDRREIEQFVREENIPFRQDKTNLHTEYTRNKIRLELLPLLRDHYNSNIDQALWQLGRTADMLCRPLSADAMADVVIEKNDQALILDAAQLSKQSQIQQAETIFQALHMFNVPLQSIGFKHITAILSLLDPKHDSPSAIQLPGQFCVKRENNKLILTQLPPTTQQQAVVATVNLTIPGTTSLPAGLVMITPDGQALPIRSITAEWLANSPGLLEEFKKNKSHTQELLDADQLDGPPVVRTRIPDDRFTPLGSSGSKTLGDFFTDRKIPTLFRHRVALIADRNDLLWITALQIADRVKVTSKTKRILKLTLE